MLITTKDWQRVLATFFFATGYHALYVDYLHPIFGYAYYRLEHREWFEWIFVYAILLLPSIWQKGRDNAVACGISLIYILLYVPGLITMCFMWVAPFSEFVILALALMIGQFIIQLAGPRSDRESTRAINVVDLITPRLQLAISVFTVVSLTIFFIENRAHMSLVGFADVYDLRFASRDASSVVSGYLSMWLLGVSVPLYLSLAVQRKQWFLLFVAVLISVVLYMGNGSKSALLMPIQAFIVGWLVAKRRSATQFLGVLMGLVMWCLYALNVEWLNLFKSLLIMRLLSTGGWTMTVYYEYFSLNGWTYYSHVGPIGAVFGKAYSLELGQLIGIDYFSSEEANFNANFWATDGVAALGAFGVIVASFLMAIILRVIYRLSRDMSQRATAILLSGLWLSILNGSLFTSMLSGGGFFLLALLLLGHQRRRAYC